MSSYVVGIGIHLLFMTIGLIPHSTVAAASPTAASSKDQVERTMCAACDNPCGQYLSPPQPTYPYSSPPPPPPYGGGGGGGGMYYPPPSPYETYLTPPPPNPILPYFPFYFHIPPGPSSTTTSESSRLTALAQPVTSAVVRFVLLLFV